MTIPSEEQRETVEEAFLDLDNILELGDGWHAGYRGYQIEALLGDVDTYQFGVHVEDIDVNIEWSIVDIESGVYSDFDVRTDDTDMLVITIEVARWP